MKLRLRSIETNETIKLEVPNACNLQLLYQTLISHCPSLPPLSSLRFSLNRKDQLVSDQPLVSLGITSGDLVYFSHNPTAFSSSPPPVLTQSMESLRESEESYDLSSGKQETLVTGFAEKDMDVYESKPEESLDSSLSNEGKHPVADFSDKADGGHDLNSDHKVLVMAIHAVFVESGFVGMRNDVDNWDSTSRLVINYTLPQLLSGSGDGDNVVESVVLKFQTLSYFVNVYGSLTCGGSEVCCARLNLRRFGPALRVLWGNYNGDKNDGSLSFEFDKEKELFEFWKAMKDGLALPLLIDLCEKVGFSLPACFTRLPMELKFKIMELLPGADIGRMACVCTEIRFLSSNTDLWRKKFAEEFGGDTKTHPFDNWKEKFAFCWDNKKKLKREEKKLRQGFPRVYRPFYFPIRRDPIPFMPPVPIIGGHYDYVPGLIIPSRGGQTSQGFHQPRIRRNFSPHCSLGGFSR